MVSQQSMYRHLSPPRYSRRQTLAVFHSPPETASTDRRSETASALSRKWVHRSVGDLSAANDANRQSPRLLSSFYHELCEKYPHAFQHKLEEREATRRVFNARPQVHFEDENTTEGRQHLNSNLADRHAHLTNWDREVGHYFNSRSNMRDCMTSAESSEMGGPSRTRNFNSQTLNRLLMEQSPLRRKFQMEADTTKSELDIQEYFLEKSKARSKHRRKYCRILQRKIEKDETGPSVTDGNKSSDILGQRNRYSKSRTSPVKDINDEIAKGLLVNNEARRKVDVNSVVADTDLKIDTLMEKISLKMSSPDSLPDSAIDIDTPSAGSFVSSSRGGNQELQFTELPNMTNGADIVSPRNASSVYENSSGNCQSVKLPNEPKLNGHLDQSVISSHNSAGEPLDIKPENAVNNERSTDDGYELEEILKDSFNSAETGPWLLQVYREGVNSHSSEQPENENGGVSNVSNGDRKLEDDVVTTTAFQEGETDIMSETSTTESFSSGVQSVQSCVERPVFQMNGSHGNDVSSAGQTSQKFRHRDSDVDSGIGQSSSGTDVEHRGRPRERTPNIDQMKASESVLPLRSEVDCCIMDEVDLVNAARQVTQQRDNPKEEDDTTDARLEVANVTDAEIKIAEKYRRTRSPSPYILTNARKPGPNRPNSAPYLTQRRHDIQIVDISISDKPEKDTMKSNGILKASNKISSCQRLETDAEDSENGFNRKETKSLESENMREELLQKIPGKGRPRCSVSSLSSSGTASSQPDNFDNMVADLPRDFNDIDGDTEIYKAGAIDSYAIEYAKANSEFGKAENSRSKGVYDDTREETKASGHERRYRPGVASPRVNEKRQKLRNKMKSKSDSSVPNVQNEAPVPQRVYATERLPEYRLPPECLPNGIDALDHGMNEISGANVGKEAKVMAKAKSDTGIGNGYHMKGSQADQRQHAAERPNDNSRTVNGTNVVRADVNPNRQSETSDSSDRLSDRTPTPGSVECINNETDKSPDAITPHKTPPVKPARTKRKKTLPPDLNFSDYKIKPNESQPRGAMVKSGLAAERPDQARSVTARGPVKGDEIETIEPATPDGRHPPVSDRQQHAEKDQVIMEPDHKSNLQKSKKLSASKTSLMDKVGTLKTATKGKFKKLRKAVSLERGIDKFSVEPNPDPYRTHDAKIDNSGPAPKMKKAPSLKSLASLFGKIKKKKKKGKWTAEEGEADSIPAQSTSANPSGRLSAGKRQQWASCQGLSTHPTTTTSMAGTPHGKLLEVHQDGTQLIHLVKPATGPMGFFIAKGSDRYKKGIFVSRLSENRGDNCFSGLLGVGDEILEVNGHFVRDLSQDAVYNLISASPVIVLKVLPLIARKDV